MHSKKAGKSSLYFIANLVMAVMVSYFYYSQLTIDLFYSGNYAIINLISKIFKKQNTHKRRNIMERFKFKQCLILFLLLTAAALYWGIDQGLAQSQESSASNPLENYINKLSITPAERQEAAERAAAARAEAAAAAAAAENAVDGIAAPLKAPLVPAPGGTPDYFGIYPNYANSPIIRKFVDKLPGLGSSNANLLGQYIPIAIADNTTYPGSDYYKIGVVEYSEKMHSDLPATKLRGYKDLATGAAAQAHYLGPMIIAKKDRPVRIKFSNLLATGLAGNLFLPVDITSMGAGTGPLSPTELYKQNRAVLHFHGGVTPWISDGTPHQWITPAGETTLYPKGASQQNVPDMPDPGAGAATYYYTNQQSGRLMWIHDHAYGLTRLNVYAGEATGYLLTDSVEDGLIDSGKIPGAGAGVYRYGIPLIIQDKTFVDAAKIPEQDPTWNWGSTPGTAHTGDLWFPHVYMTNQNPWDDSGANAMGRWDYGAWFWPPVTTLAHMTVPNPYAALPGEPPEIPGTPNPSLVPEAFMDTPIVNGTPYPFLPVEPKAYRFRILNACNDRTLNLQLYIANPDNVTEVKMVPAVQTAGFPDTWPTDGRSGGVPDPATAGPSMIQIGTEGGFLPAPVVLPNTPVGYNYNRRDIVVLNITNHTLMLGPAERADVIIDFSGIPSGSKVILYNDAPAPVPAFDPRLDYYTGSDNQTSTGGAPPTLVGFGPNTRTIMRFDVAGSAGAAFNLAGLQTAWPAAYTATQPPPIVPQKAYGAATDTFARIQSTALTYTPIGSTVPVTTPLQPKAIQELFELDYGRMNATLGVELPFTNFNTQTTLPFGYIDPPTETLLNGAVQIWKITHNGVDTHPVHFHLFNVQLVNRVGWDGAIRPPEPNELGWKETVRMNPLEDAIVALKPVAPTLPFAIPDSHRPLDVTRPIGSVMGFANLDPLTGNPIVVTNEMTNFGWEYVWHCHILGHEENDFMRPIVFQVPQLPPSAATGLTATAVGQRQINLAWTGTAASKTVGFRIERATGAGAFSAITTVQVNTTTFSDTTALPGTTYLYVVYAFNAAGDSPPSNIATATTFPPPPTAPSRLTATAVSTGQVNLTWRDNANNETGFRIERATGAGAFALLTTVGANVASYADMTVSAATTYSYRVLAYNSAGNSGFSNTATATTPAATPPAAPTSLTATLNPLSSSPPSTVLSWIDNANNETSFSIQRATNAGFTAGLTTFTVGANITTYTDGPLVLNTTYYYRVKAVNSFGSSAYTNNASVTTPSVLLPANPTNLAFVSSTILSITISWTDNAANEQGFYVFRSTTGANGAYTLVGTVLPKLAAAPSTVSFTNLLLTRGTTYWYKVRAYNSAGSSSYTNILAAATKP